MGDQPKGLLGETVTRRSRRTSGTHRVGNGGSRGDAQPYLALGTELRRRGHEVVVVTYSAYERVVKELGLSFAGMSGDPQKIVEDLAEAGQDVVRYARRFRQVFEPLLERHSETLEGCRGRTS